MSESLDSLRDSPYTDKFSRQLSVSAILHILFFLFFIVRAAWVPRDELLIRNAIRVDMVALPDKPNPDTNTAPHPAHEVAVKPVLTKAEPVKSEPVPLKKPEKKSDLKKIEANQRKALEQLKAQDAIDRMKSELQDKATRPKAKPPTFAGNVLNNGDSLTGLEKIEFDRYLGDIEKKIKQHWNLPGWLVEAQLRAQAIVLIDGSGQVVKRHIKTTSGNDVFDEQVLTAIDNAAPFPEPPARLKDVLALKGIVFNFPD